MVGYRKHDSLTINQKLIAGCLSGVMTRFITQPLDVIKLRLQLQRQDKQQVKTNVRKTASKIMFEEGFSAFWHGHLLGQVYSVLSVSSQFYVFELTTKYASSLEMKKEYRPYSTFVCGIIAGCSSATLVIPIEVIRVRQMLVKDQYGGFFKGAAAVYRYGGILAFYEGLSASLLQMGPQIGISFLVFNTMQPWILKQMHDCDDGNCNHSKFNKHTPLSLVLASSVSGCIAGLVSKTATYPFDLAKKRLQVGSHRSSGKYEVPSTSRDVIKCKNLTDCIKATVQKEGAMGLFRGWSVTIGKAQLTSVVAFTTYEMFCFIIREIDHP